MEHETSLLFGILGLVAGAIGVIVTVKLYYKVKNIEKKRRDDQKTHFKELVANNIEEVLHIYQSVIILAHRKSFTPEETEDKTIELQDLFVKKQTEIENLARDTKFYASMLSVIDTPSVNMKEIVEKITWLINDFYILKHSVKKNNLHWIAKEQELRNNSDFIASSLTDLNSS